MEAKRVVSQIKIMSWPAHQDYSEAVQNPLAAFADAELKRGQVEVNNLGLPKPCSGAFAVVFRIKVPSRSWAVKCFTSEVPDQHQHYDAISKHLAGARLSHIVPFTYLPAGIKVQGRTYPLLKMEWIQGDSLGVFIERNLNNPTALRALADKWIKMIAALQAAGIAHGDLQHGNILVVGGEFRLIDYDGMFVPALRGRRSGELGQRNYQHPARTESHFAPQLDNFSAWLIWFSIKVLIVHPDVWRKYNGGDECLILRKEDFLDPSNSGVLRELSNSPNNEIQALTELFVSFQKLSPLGVPPIDENIIRKTFEAWEEKNRRRLLWQKRKRQMAFAASLSFAVICGLMVLHLWLLSRTSLSFELSLDGKVFPSNRGLNVMVDGKPFSAGDKIGLGHHLVEASFSGGEPFSKMVWTFYGKNNLGLLPLETSKGSLSVAVKPSPAKIILQQENRIIQQGDDPLKMDKLPVGDYTLLIRRGEYEESYPIKIQREQLTETNIELNLGNVDLASVPPDAEFELSGNERHWQGKLPMHIDDVPAGDYQLITRRKGWELDEHLTVNRGKSATGNVEFKYGSIAVTSDPAGMNVSTNGVEIGKTPITLRELQPGKYKLTATDGENDLLAEVDVAPKEAAKHNFVFRYGTVQLSSTPSGAIVIRSGREIGKTPLTLGHITTEETMVELRLQDYLSTNLPIRAVESTTSEVSAKLISERYVQAMKQARETLDANQFEQASNSVAMAIEADPTDTSAPALLAEITQRAAAWRQQQIEAVRLAAEEKAREAAAELEAISLLSPEGIIKDCWNTPGKPAPSDTVNLGEVAKQNPVALPVWAATDIIVEGIKVIAWPFQKLTAKKQPRFIDWEFRNNYQNHDYRYYGKIVGVDVKNNTITFASGGTGKQSYGVVARLNNPIIQNVVPLKTGLPIWISGNLIALAEVKSSGPAANRLVLDNSTVYAPTTLAADK